MAFVLLNVATAVLALYVAYRVFQAWRRLSDIRLSLYFTGMALLAFSLLLEAVAELFLPPRPRHLWRQLWPVELVVALITLAALVLIAIAVTPATAYVLPIVMPVNIFLALYIAVVTLIKAAERQTAPWISLAFIFLAASMATPAFSLLNALFRLLTAAFLALSLAYAAKTEK